MTMVQRNVEVLEIDLLLTGIHRHYGYDSKQYSRGSLERRIKKFMVENQFEKNSDIQNLVLHDPVGMQ
jgi:chemotaxis protein methyltransferase CheR